MKHLLPIDHVDRRIYYIRGHRVMLDRDLAAMYGVPTSRLNEQVKRNQARFPDDFSFRLTKDEMRNWISQFATSNSTIKMGLRKPPYVFTEHGAVAAAFVLNSPVAVAASIQVVRAFVRLREMIASNKELAHKLAQLERKLEGHDDNIRELFAAIHDLMEPPIHPRPAIGFRPHKK